MKLWHLLFHRNPKYYPLAFGMGCNNCDSIRLRWIEEDIRAGHLTWADVAKAYHRIYGSEGLG